MKILVIQKNVKNPEILKLGLNMANDSLKKIGLTLEFDYRVTSRSFSSVGFANDVNFNGHMVNSVEIFQEAKTFDTPFDIDLLYFDWTTVSPQPTNPVTSGMNMQIPEQWCGTPAHPEVLSEFFLHELCHFFFGKTGKIDKTHDYIQEFSQLSRSAYYLYLLQELIITPMPNNVPAGQTTTPPTYKYFNPKSDPAMIGVSPMLMSFIDKVRELCGFPIILSSGLRTISQNITAGGKPNSAHLRGLAVDILCIDPQKRSKLIKVILQQPTPVFLELAVEHLHIDLDTSIHTMGDTIVSSDE